MVTPSASARASVCVCVCGMIAILVPCTRAPHEDIDTYFRRRRRRLARNLCQDVGLWSSMWSDRVMSWDAHLRRGTRYNHRRIKGLNGCLPMGLAIGVLMSLGVLAPDAMLADPRPDGRRGFVSPVR